MEKHEEQQLRTVNGKDSYLLPVSISCLLATFSGVLDPLYWAS